MTSLTAVISAVMLVLPVPLLLTGLLVGIKADNHPQLIRRLTTLGATYAFVSALLAALGYALGMHGSKTYAAVVLPAHLGKVALSIYADPLTVIMLLLVTFVGLVVARYSASYMEGDDHEGQFHRWLSFTLAAFLTLIMTSNFWAFIIASFATTLFLGQLLSFYRDRPSAVLAAHKKSIFSLAANASMLAAFVLVARTLHTSDFGHMQLALSGVHHLPLALEIAAGLVALSAVLKSAQFPTHGWLIQVMEAPTPVSALLHAGVIYTGTFFILRMSPMMSRVIWTGDALVLIGLVSIVVGSTIMMTATAIKASLAYSTLAQMGFMLMECGLGVYSVAVLHIVSHSLYKAHAFLASGSVVENFREPALPPVFNAGSVRRALVGLVVAVAMTLGIGSAFGVLSYRQLAVLTLGLIVALAVTHLLLQALNIRGSGTKGLILWIGGLSAAVVTAYFALHSIFTTLLAPSLPSAPVPTGIAEDILLAVIIAVFLGLLALQQLIPTIMKRPRWRAVYVHLYNGLYVDMVFTRLLLRRSSARLSAEKLELARAGAGRVEG